MSIHNILDVATGGNKEIPLDWMSASQTRPLILEDPVILWLEFHGKEHGFNPDTSPYDFVNFIGTKAREFEEKWVAEIASVSKTVCSNNYDVHSVDKVNETFELMLKGSPVIVHPALWWEPERIYGVPDLIIHTSWIGEKFQNLISDSEQKIEAKNLEDIGLSGHYVVFDIKFTTKLEESSKVKDLRIYSTQVRIYNYMLGHIQGAMPSRSFFITRDRVFNPLSVDCISTLNQPLDDYLINLRDKFLEIKLNGSKYLPWRDDIVSMNLDEKDERWGEVKKIIAKEKVPGADPRLVAQISSKVKKELALLGYHNLESLIKKDPNKLDLKKCKGIGDKKEKQIKAILKANRSKSLIKPAQEHIPLINQIELYIDFEYFTNVNVDFNKQWPNLEGCKMIFMIGVGWIDSDNWNFKSFIAESEDQIQERKIIEEFINFLDSHTNGAFTDSAKTTFYHWSSAEVTQSRKAADRHEFSQDHHLRKLPWNDLRKIFLDNSCCIPGAWTYELKEVANTLGKIKPEFDPKWPGNLDKGLRAMVMGWKAYQQAKPLESEEMKNLKEYLEADCRALWNILKWMRSKGE